MTLNILFFFAFFFQIGQDNGKMSGISWIEGLILISPHLLMMISVIVVALAVSSVFLNEEHIFAGVCITVFATIAAAVCIMGFWQGYG